MDSLDRANQVLARARARRADIVTPDSATSPMDLTNTVQIPRVTVAADPRTASPDDAMVIPSPVFTRKPRRHGNLGPAQPPLPHA
ncbi:MAG TPA: hypothetical protein VJT72_22560 [Pseudonocardiaceae bacterium]|nr:hypothetical protein [Pseudonocardiaceae bacterium]